jgi:hypothetical protein
LCFSQSSFILTLKDTITDQVINDALELESGSFILVGHEVYPKEQSKVHLYRISDSGQLLEARILAYQGQPSGFIKIAQINPDRFVLAGNTINNTITSIWLYEIDSLFNELHSRIFPIANYNLFNITDFQISNGCILCSGNIESFTNLPYAFIYKISQTFDSLQLRIFIEHTTLLPINLLPKQKN